MPKPAIPANEGGRLANLYCLELLDSPPDDRFERVLRYTGRLLSMPAGYVSLLDSDREWFLARQAVGIDGLDRDEAPGAWAILQNEELLVPDLAADSRFADGHLAREGWRFFAGRALISPDGYPLGVLAVLDRAPRPFTAADSEVLRDMAAWAEAELATTHHQRSTEGLGATLDAANTALMKQTHLDALTHLWDRNAILSIAERELKRARRERKHVAIVLADLDHFRVINDTHGRVTGNVILQEIGQRMRNSLRGYDAIGRFEGDCFLIVFTGINATTVLAASERLRTCVSGQPMGIYEGELSVTVSVGVTLSDPESDASAGQLVEAAEAALAKAKWAGCNRVEVV